MGELVGNDIGDELLLVLRRCRRIDQQEVFAERDAAEVLHRAGGEIGEGQQIDLVAGVRDAVVVLEPAQAERGDIEPVLGQGRLAGNVHDANRHAVDVDPIGGLEWADHEGHEVRAHHHRVREADLDASVVAFVTARLGGVGHGEQTGLNDQGDREHRFEVRFVPARKGATAVGRLHLGSSDHVLTSVGSAIGAPVPTAQLIVQDASEGDRDEVGAGGDPGGRRHEQALARLVESELDGRAVEGARVDIELDRVQRQLGDIVLGRHGDRHRAAERRAREIGLEHEFVSLRRRVPRQPEGIESDRVGHPPDGTGRRTCPGRGMARHHPVPGVDAVACRAVSAQNGPLSPDHEARYDVVGIGNALVDVISHAPDDFLDQHGLTKGWMDLIDTDRAVQLYRALGSAVEMSGGSAANTMCGVASFGGSAAYIGKVTRDELGEVFGHDLLAVGVQFRPGDHDNDVPTGRCIIVVTPDAERTMNTYLGASSLLAVDDVDDAAVADGRILYMEGYLFDRDDAKQAFRHAAAVAHDAERMVSLTLSDSFCVDRHRDDFCALVSDEVDLLFGNEAELVSLYETETFDDAVDELRRHCEFAAITVGARGSIIVTADDLIEVPAVPVRKVIDTTGAGDLYAAGFLHGLTTGKSLPDCGLLGSIAAAEVISHVGPRPLVELRTLVA